MKPKIYIETSFISYLTSRPNRDLIIAAHQQISNEWWQNRKDDFNLFISQLVIEEASKGDENAASKRMELIRNIPILELNDQTIDLVNIIQNEKIISDKNIEDIFHIAIATMNGMDYLLTWNCKHIANATIRNKIEEVCRLQGFQCPIICTPEELLGD